METNHLKIVRKGMRKTDAGDDTFVINKITNNHIYAKLLEMEKKLDRQKWHIKALWLVTGGIGGFLMKFLVLKP